MNILLIANYVNDGQQSMQRFADMLELGLKQAGHTVRVVRPQPVFGRLKPSATGLGKWLGYIDKFLLFPLGLRRAIAWADVVHICDHSNAFYASYLQQVPHVITCNDLLAIRSALGEIPENPTRWSGRQLQQLILKGLNSAQRVVCISERTRQDLLRISALPPEAATRVYMGLNYPYAPMTITTARHQVTQLGVPAGARYLIHVGGNHWYKNRLGVVQIFQALRSRLAQSSDGTDGTNATDASELDKELDNLYLVMAGQPLPDHIQAWIDAHDLRHWVIEAHNVSNEDLRALYSAATALLFPSLQEGFGWPIIEAQACGCPAFTSNRAPMTEVGGTAAIYLEPEDIEASAARVAEALPHLSERTHASLANAQQFTPEAMIAAYVREYQQVIAERDPALVASVESVESEENGNPSLSEPISHLNC